MSEGAVLLQRAVDVLLGEDPVELPGPAALDRLRVLLVCTERLRAAQLFAVRDMDRRELYALDAAGSARGWLRRQPGGEDGQVTLARRLAERRAVSTALRDARIGLRSAAQLCTALELVPDDLDDALVTAVVQDGIGRLLVESTGGTPQDEAAAAAVLAQRTADTAVLAGCCTDVAADPATRMEPAFVLLAERLPAAQLASALRLLLDPLQPDGTDQPERDRYYLELRILADGDVDVRGLLDPETGQNLAAEIERRLEDARLAAARTRRAAADVGAGRGAAAATVSDEPHQPEPSGTSPRDVPPEDAAGSAGTADRADSTELVDSGEPADPGEPGDAGEPADPGGPGDARHPAEDPLLDWDLADAEVAARAARRAAQPGGDRGPDAPLRPTSAGRRRHDALRDLLADAAGTDDAGRPAPAHLTVVATLEAVEGRPGALPGQLITISGRSVHLRPETLQRLGCDSQLDAVLIDAHGNPVGASSTRRMPNRRERRALRARWGATCAVDGCSHTRTVPHHVVPWWLSGLTRLQDLVPLCSGCHHDLHEGHRTLRLRDGRLIDDRGWAAAQSAAA